MRCQAGSAAATGQRGSSVTPFRKALVTGASSGLGRALAMALAAEGVALILVARSTAQLQALAKALPVPVEILSCDLAIAEQRKHLVELIWEKQPDLIINNAGFGLYGDATAHPTSAQLEMVEVNACAVLEITLEGARALHQNHKRGTICNISSAAAFFAYPTFAVYAATKGFVNQVSMALDQELAPHGVRVLTCCPGQVATEFRNRASGGYPQAREGVTLSLEKAVRLILKQIARGKRLEVIDWRYKWMCWLSRWIPSSLLMHKLQGSLKQRHGFTSFQGTRRADGE